MAGAESDSVQCVILLQYGQHLWGCVLFPEWLLSQQEISQMLVVHYRLSSLHIKRYLVSFQCQ
jgi:hypothetical protein